MKFKLLILIFTILTSFFSCKKEAKTIVTTERTNQIQGKIENLEQGKHCYQYIMDNSYKKDGKLVIEKDFININLKINNKDVEGDYIITSNKGEMNNGHFIGNIDNDIITTIHTYKNTNTVLKDEFVFKITPNKIAILGGEKKLVDGVNMFVDKSKCDYMMELLKIDCN